MAQVTAMHGEAGDQRRGWGLSASVLAHLLVAALALFGLPTLTPPPSEQVVSVTLEPPPNPPAAQAAEPPPKPPEARAAETPAPAKPVEPQPDLPAAAPRPALDPVVRFGAKDAGPRRSLAGSGAADDPVAPAPSPVAREQPVAQQEPVRQDPLSASPAGAEQAPAGAEAESAAGLLVAAAPAERQTAPAAPSVLPAPRPAHEAGAAASPRLHEARTLFSRTAEEDATATTAMADIPRGVRAGRLCATELRLQLVDGGHAPNLLPTYELRSGTVLAVRRGAFRAGGTWYNLSFECQVDADATGVVSFALGVGQPLSPADVRRRGLPSQ